MRERNFSWLLSALLGFLIIVPIAGDFGLISGPVMRTLMFSWLLAFGVLSLKGFGFYYPLGISFAVAGIVLSVVSTFTPGDAFVAPSLIAAFGFVFIAVWCTGKQVIFSTEVSMNRVIGAVNLYLLMGVLWAILYAISERLLPGSFSGLSEQLEKGWSSDWLYFSFVTMTTLGYGDITPVSATSRTLAHMQAVFGQFYLAILVAGLVGAYISESRPR